MSFAIAWDVDASLWALSVAPPGGRGFVVCTSSVVSRGKDGRSRFVKSSGRGENGRPPIPSQRGFSTAMTLC